MQLPEGLQKLDYYAEQFISGRLVYQRFSPREQHGCAAGGEANVIASILAGAEDRTDSDSSETLSEYQRECKQGAHQDIYLSDMHDENVIRSTTGAFCVVDCDIRINTPELRCGGNRRLVNVVEFL